MKSTVIYHFCQLIYFVAKCWKNVQMLQTVLSHCIKMLEINVIKIVY